jgi:formylglycine-generating enzyme required for sulfatase activity
VVGSYEAEARHPWGLCDMHGNVWQWCANWHNSEQKVRILRGGNWFFDSESCRSAGRYRSVPVNAVYGGGFRVVVAQD